MNRFSAMLVALVLVSFAIARPAYALSEESSHYTGTDDKAQYDDPDEKTGFGDSPQSSPGAQSGREQYLLGTAPQQQTYGFGSRDGALSYGFSQGPASVPYYQRH